MAPKVPSWGIRRRTANGSLSHHTPKAHLFLDKSTELRSENMIDDDKDIIKLRDGRKVPRVFTKPTSRLRYFEDVDHTSPEHNHLPNSFALGSNPSQRDLRSSTRLRLPAPDSDYSSGPRKKLALGAPLSSRRKFASLGPPLKQQFVNPDPSFNGQALPQSSQKVLRSGRRLALPPTPKSVGKRKRKGDTVSSTPPKRHLKAPKPKSVLIDCSICAERKYS